MGQALPSFRNPPVIETVLSLQFQPLKGMSNAHLGLFWNRVRKDYPVLEDAPPIDPQFERFGADLPRAVFPPFRITMGHQVARLQMSSSDQHMMLQFQNGRLVFNWRRLTQAEEYPRWTELEPRFRNAVLELRGFAESEKLGTVEPNQWEVVYVNHMVKGREWMTPTDWRGLFPGVIGATDTVSCGKFESAGLQARFVLPGNAGRLHIELTHGFAGPEEGAEESLIVQLTARGGIDESSDLWSGLANGHEAIVRTFAEITGERVRREVWKQEVAER
jgi:uncharacterized protein (TIGR04255 family)